MTQFFGRTFWIALGFMAFFYLLALLGYTTELSLALLFGIGLSGGIVAFVRPEKAMYLPFIELVSNPHGVLLQASVGGFSMSLRMALFAGVMAGWFAAWVFRRVSFSIRDNRLAPFALLGLAVALGLIVGVLNNDPMTVFADMNGYLYLLYLAPLLSVTWTSVMRRDLLQIIAAGAIWSTLLSLLLVYIYSHFGETVLRATYGFFRDLRVAEITFLSEGIYRVFLQTHLFSIMLGLFGLALAGKDRLFEMVSAMSASVAVLLGMSRSFWVGLIPALVVVRTLKLKQAFFGLLIGVVCVVALVFFPFPRNTISGGAFADAYKDRATQTEDAGISSRWNLLTPMLDSAFESPLIGQGFGATVTFETDDPRARAINPDGTWTTYSMEWGWLELWLKMGVLGPLAFLYIGYVLYQRLQSYRFTDQAWLGRGLIACLVFLFATHMFSPYLNHPLGLGFLLLCIVFLPTENDPEKAVVSDRELIVGRSVQPSVAPVMSE